MSMFTPEQHRWMASNLLANARSARLSIEGACGSDGYHVNVAKMIEYSAKHGPFLVRTPPLAPTA